MKKLPRLAFGNHAAAESSLPELSARLEEWAGSTLDLTIPDAHRGFQGRMASITVGQQEFAAFAHTPATLSLGQGKGCSFLATVA